MTPNGHSHDSDPLTNATGEQGLPLITITGATPQKASVAQTLAGLSTPTSNTQTPPISGSGSAKGADSPYRSLYRGALSLPDSYLQLDGIAFSARLPDRQASALQDSPSCPPSRSEAFARELMYNPLALTLESMHGRQSLRFKGTVCLQDMWLDDTGDVYMDIHPFATLTRIYFENIFCLCPLVTATHDAYGPKRTEVGVRVSLGDTDGPETTDIVIYGETSALLHPPPLQLSPAATSTSAGSPPLSMRVARIMTAPRPPRPDDPTPRIPPAHLFGSTTIGDLGANKRILMRPNSVKGKDKAKVEEQVMRQAREVMLHLPRSRVPGGKTKDRNARDDDRKQNDTVFKVPEVPAKVRRKHGDGGTDVFGTVKPTQSRHVNGKGKSKASVADLEDRGAGDAIEAANKSMLKKLTVRHLSNAGMPRSHPEFKEVYSFVYRGAAFALRLQIKALQISAQAAEAVIEAHVKLYALKGHMAQDTSHERISPDIMDVDNAGD